MSAAPDKPVPAPGSASPSSPSEHRATDAFGELVYADLRARARLILAKQSPGGSWCPTELVNECFVKLGGRLKDSFVDSEHFFQTAAKAMRHILVDHARRKNRIKHGGAVRREELDTRVQVEDRTLDLVALDEALTALGKFDPLMASAVELRTFSGSTLVDTAKILGLKQHEFEKRWAATRSWLYARLD